MITLRGMALAVLALALAAPSPAQTVDGTLAEAVAAAKAKQFEAAAKTFGRAAALAQKANDLMAEQRVAVELRGFLASAPDRAQALAGVLASLDARRAGAFVAAAPIAGELVLLATRDGNTNHVGEASKVLAAQAAAPKCGKATRALAAYAKAMETIAMTKGGADVLGALEGVLKTMVEEGWTDLAIHAGTELAAQGRKSGNDPKAKAALAAVGSLFNPQTDVELVQTWRALVKARLEAAPKEVLEPFEAAMKPFSGGTSSAAQGGAGGPGGAGGTVSKLGKAWDKLSPTQNFVNVKRLDDGFEITGAFDPALKAKEPLGTGCRHRSEGGVTLSFFGRGVALWMLDMQGNQGQPGSSSSLPPGTPLYRLARGETWTVGRHGVVSIAGG